MKKIILASSILAVASFAQLSQAAPVTGNINFTGTLTTATCALDGGDDVAVPMGLVPFQDIDVSDLSAITPQGEAKLVVSCADAAGITSIDLKLSPTPDINPILVKLAAGGATGAGIALLNADNTIRDLSIDANRTLNETLVKTGDDGVATFNLKAAYVKNTDPAVGGDANAVLPFVLDYQ
ncbi:MAG: fimbrial protein [Pseudomonadota bacterium]